MRIKVPIYGTAPAKATYVEQGATVGAQIGVNLLMPSGKVGTLAQLQAMFGSSTTGGTNTSNTLNTTDDLDEGQWHLWFTERRAQDAVGGILADSANVTLSYVGGTSLTADLTDLADSHTGALLAITRDAKGRITGTRDATITGTAGRITVDDGDASDGPPTIDLATVTDTGGGILQRTAFDAYGRKTGTSAATTTDLTEGSNLYFTSERAQDAAGAALDGTGDVPLTYDDAGNKISAALSAGVLASLALADSATQPGDLATVATTGAYADLSGLPTLGTAAATDATDYATATQGALADSAVQPGDLGTAAALNVPASGDAGPTEVVLGSDSRLGGGGGGSGDVVGPASSVDGDLVLFDGITGKLIKSGGALAAAVRGVVLTGLSLATSAAISATDTVLQAFGKLQAQITDNLLPADHIDGLKMVWVSGTALTVTTGAAYIPGLGKVLRATSDIAKSSLSLTASTWYHVYLYDNAGTPDVEIVTTAPAAPYNGTARTKTGDTSRRYVVSVRTDGSGNIYSVYHIGNQVVYTVPTGSAPFRILSAGNSGTFTTVSASSVVPSSSTLANLFINNTSASVGMQVGITAAMITINPNGGVAIPQALSASQSLGYRAIGSTPSCYIDVLGYVFER